MSARWYHHRCVLETCPQCRRGHIIDTALRKKVHTRLCTNFDIWLRTTTTLRTTSAPAYCD